MTILAFFLVAALQLITETLHIDIEFPTSAAAVAESELGRLPLSCNEQGDYTVQFVWRTTLEQEIESLDRDAIEERLTVLAEQVNYLFWREADSYDVSRFPRWRTDKYCRLDMRYLAYNEPAPALVNTKQIIIEKRFDYCGLATTFSDDRPGSENAHNASSNAWISTNCLSAFVVAHEFLHGIGAVPEAASHSIRGRHSSEKGDVMNAIISPYCASGETLDCGKDDYWSGRKTLPHWNAANSLYLVNEARYTVILPLMMRND